MTVEVKIGVQNASRELVVESNQSTEDITAALREALGAGDDSAVFSLTDAKGKVIVVPTAKLAYVEIGRSVSGQVGFRS
ncbi:hypothetical protein HNR19_002983 [Nocardioides thalensis]|uniref:DUF3107 domain-containing protein n=1 Tax=Nocardioides thalensis TaxID=1914755 RepID=A0A853C3K7_9ACTN|nr:DUF3107 domain-containing protein [Nocardioides thalensis]NYJ02285.1 hypothetical protein [Nocardioides thalensis]